MIKAILVDDEQNNLDNLLFMLENDCDGIEVLGCFQTADAARTYIVQNEIDVIFLDINMPNENGFDMLELLQGYHFKVIFVTAYSEYALKALKASAIDYLLKPIGIIELQTAVQKLQQAITSELEQQQQRKMIETLTNNIKRGGSPSKLALPQIGGMLFLDVDEIIVLQADSNYTIVYKQNMQKVVVSKLLKEFEAILDSEKFLRIHKSHIINLSYVNEYSTKDGCNVTLQDGSSWSISRRQIDEFLNKIKKYNVRFFA
jgi:two-component system LytT family response regulator